MYRTYLFILLCLNLVFAQIESEFSGYLLDLMEQMNRERKITFVFSSHDQQVIQRAKRLLILKDGQIVEDKTIEG
jgi:putative ABC transport system ATP-binding protein